MVDDGSKDDTIPILQTMIEDYPLVVLELSRNFGKEAALSAGLDHVTGEVALLIDADFQHPFEAIPTMINLWKMVMTWSMVFVIVQPNHGLNVF